MRAIATQVFAKKIDEIGLQPVMVRRIAEFMGTGGASCTVGEVVERINATRRQKFHAVFVRRLLALGLNRIDWVMLPSTSVTAEDLSALPRDEFLSLPAEMLGFQQPTLRSIAPLLCDDDSMLTVGDVLMFDVPNVRRVAYCLKNYKDSIASARAFLRQILTPKEIERYRFMHVTPREFENQ